MNFLGQGFQTLEHYRQTDGQMRPNVLLRRIRGWLKFRYIKWSFWRPCPRLRRGCSLRGLLIKFYRVIRIVWVHHCIIITIIKFIYWVILTSASDYTITYNTYMCTCKHTWIYEPHWGGRVINTFAILQYVQSTIYRIPHLQLCISFHSSFELAGSVYEALNGMSAQ